MVSSFTIDLILDREHRHIVVTAIRLLGMKVLHCTKRQRALVGPRCHRRRRRAAHEDVVVHAKAATSRFLSGCP